MRHQRNHRQHGRSRPKPRPSAIPAVAPRQLAAVVIALAVGWSVLALYAVHIELPVNALDLPLESNIKPTLQAIVPQGWGFFTRDPREPRLIPLVRAAGSWQVASEGPNGEPWNAFGLNRAARAQGVEVGLLETAIPAEAWKDCETEVAACLERMPATLQLSNPTPRPTLCGEVGFARRESVPWAWAASTPDETSMPSKVVRVRVTC